MFFREDFDNCKIRMKSHLVDQDDYMWYVIIDAPIKFLKANTTVAVTKGSPQMAEKNRINGQMKTKSNQTLIM